MPALALKSKPVLTWCMVRLNSKITAIDRVDVTFGAEIIGDIKACVLIMEPGAIFVGRSTVGSSAAATKTPSTAPKSA